MSTNEEITVVSLAKARNEDPVAINLWHHLPRLAGPLPWSEFRKCEKTILDRFPTDPYTIDTHDTKLEGKGYDLWYFIPDKNRGD